jgi:CcmD family protein
MGVPELDYGQPEFQFMFYGFTAAWLIVFVYILTLVRRGNRIRAELKRQEALLERPDLRS